MRSLIYLVTALGVMGLAFWAYRVNYDTQDKRDELRGLEREIVSLNEGLGVLKAEWAYLNRPDRLRELVNLNFTDLQLLPLQSTQFASVSEIPYPNPVEMAEPDAQEGADIFALNDGASRTGQAPKEGL